VDRCTRSQPASRVSTACALVAAAVLSSDPARADPTLAAAGDIACAPADADYNGGLGTATRCRMRSTSDLILAQPADAVLVLGDNQYDTGALADFQTSFAASWGRLANLRAVVGNHEYLTPGAAGHFAFFGAAAGSAGQGYFSFDLGSWHVVVLNSNCPAVGGCEETSPQGQWLAADLAAHPADCTLAAWHHPRYSSGPHGDDAVTGPLWDLLMRHRAELVLVGHDHIYERFAPQGNVSDRDIVRGLRQFTVGTGGRGLTGVQTVRPNVEARSVDRFGVLFLTLGAGEYAWSFEGVGGGAAIDSGSARCHGGPHGFHPLPPCRALDTRNGAGGALVAGERRRVNLADVCGIPAHAMAVATNWTATGVTSTGQLTVGPASSPAEPASSASSVVSFRSGRTRAGFATVPLGENGAVDATAAMASGTLHLVVDVSGYFD
jgi:hypothetical protein